MREIKFRLIENNKIVGYEKHTRSGSEGLKVFHSVINDDSEGWEWWNTNDLTKWIRHDEKEQYTDKKDKNGKEIYEGDKYKYANQEPVHVVEDLVKFGDVLRRLGDYNNIKYPYCSVVEIIGNIHEKITKES